MDSKITNTDVRNKLKAKVCEEIQRFRQCPAVGEDVAYSGDYVISFSLDYDSTLMWSEYSNFLGYCLSFDFEKLYNGFDDFCAIQHGKVIYNHDEQINLNVRTIEKEVIDWNSEFDYIKSWEDFNNLSDENIDDLYTYLAVIIEAYNQFFKLPCFEGEHEYRFIFFCGHEGGRLRPKQLDKQYFRVKDEVLIPFVKKKVSLDGLEEVLVGPKNKSCSAGSRKIPEKPGIERTCCEVANAVEVLSKTVWMWRKDRKNMILLEVLNIIALIVVPIGAVLLGQFFQDRKEKRRDKLKVFEILMSSRMYGWTKESVYALNILDVIFVDDIKVRSAWKDLYDKLCVDNPDVMHIDKVQKARQRLLEEMAVSLGYKDKITWENIQNVYMPVGLQNEIISQSNSQDNYSALLKSMTEMLGNSNIDKTVD